MTIDKLTQWPTEADLEAAIPAALQRIFPFLAKGGIRHQTKFAFDIGRRRIEVDGTKHSRTEGRADVLLYDGDKPLAVMELKRPGVALTEADEKQGLSYASMLRPRPPLVVVTNGTELRMLETHSGAEWVPVGTGEAAFRNLIESAGRAASDDMKNAIRVLMGNEPQVWMQAVRHASASTIDELTGSWTEWQLPFVRDLLMPRRGTAALLELLRRGSRLITLEGAPLSGKSNVLRELDLDSRQHDDIAILYLEADAGSGVYQTIADILRSALSWPVTKEEAREWLVQISQMDAPMLVLAIDGLEPGRNHVRDDIDDLTGQAFGNGIRAVVAMDDVIADRVIMNSTGRKFSAIGRRADRLFLGLLDNAEYETAVDALRECGLYTMAGGEKSEELRVPWIVRAVASRYEDGLAAGREGALIPPVLSLDLIAHARERFSDEELRRLFTGVAQAVIEEARDMRRSPGMILQSVASFTVRRVTLRKHLRNAEIEQLLAQSLLKPFQPQVGDAMLGVRHSELLAAEIAGLLSEELAHRSRKNPEKAATWIGSWSSRIPLGDIVAAQAIADAILEHQLPVQVIVELLQTPPKRHVVQPGTRSTVHFPGLGSFEMTFREQGLIEVALGGQQHVLAPDPGEEDEHAAYSDYGPWLILSHLAGLPLMLETESERGRIDTALLLEVGSSPIVLRRPGGAPDVAGILTHDVPGIGSIVCHRAGMVETITWSMFGFLSSQGSDATSWVEEAVRRQSLPLLARVDVALRFMRASTAPGNAAWAAAMLETLVAPAFRDLPSLHPNNEDH